MLFSSERALWTASDSGGKSSRSGEILQIFNFFDYHSKDFLHIMHHEGRQYVDQEYVNICSKKYPVGAILVPKMTSSKLWIHSSNFLKNFSDESE